MNKANGKRIPRTMQSPMSRDEFSKEQIELPYRLYHDKFAARLFGEH
jgi:hypothetical protein